VKSEIEEHYLKCPLSKKRGIKQPYPRIDNNQILGVKSDNYQPNAEKTGGF
jgi:hypothetical protein